MSAQTNSLDTGGQEQQDTKIPANELPSAEAFEEQLKDAPLHHPAFEEASAGFIGGLKRLATGVPDAFWIKNTHTEPIKVVSSRLRPHRLWTSSEINASADGAGVGFNTSLYSAPASQATVGPNIEFRFPLWSSSDSYGVVSIYDAATGAIYIENDRIRAGYRVNFAAGQSLQLFDYKGRPQAF